MTFILRAFALSFAVLTVPAQAATIYDEAVSGDIATFPMQDLGELSSGPWTIFATLDGGAESGQQADKDEQDSILFTALQPFRVFTTSLSGTGIGSLLYRDATINSAAAGTYVGSASNASAATTTWAAGTYGLLIYPFNNRNVASYRVDIIVEPVGAAPVPLPAAGLLLAGATGMLGMLRRRKRIRAAEAV